MKIRRLLVIVALTAVAVGVSLRVSGWFRAAARDGVAPYQRFAVRAGASLRGWTAWLDAVAVQAENEDLRQRVRELELERTAFQGLRTENRALRRQLGFVRSMPGLVSADVLSHGGTDGWSQRIRIGKGRRHGVLPDAPVLAPEGLVGRVVEATASTADVLLITDPNSRVACAFDPDIPSARGILFGGGQTLAGPARPQLLHTLEPLRLTYLEKDLTIPESARVVTSGLGGIYPRGLPVGVIARTDTDASGLFLRAEVVPFVDFATLRQVAVLVDAGAVPAREGRTR